MSICGQQGCAQSHCNNLESLAYTLIYAACSEFPWTAISHDQKAVLQKKKLVTTEELCKGLPAQFCKFIGYACSLGFDKKPDYQYLHSISHSAQELRLTSSTKCYVPPLALLQIVHQFPVIKCE
jgi:hypothetical protein